MTDINNRYEPPIDIQGILDLLPHRYPFIMVDRILDFEKGKTITGLKNVSMGEPFFQGHFPGEPVMPGVLILEGMAQVGVLLAYLSHRRLLEKNWSFLPAWIMSDFEK